MRQGNVKQKVLRFATTVAAAALGVGALMTGVGTFLPPETQVEVTWEAPHPAAMVVARAQDANSQAAWRKDVASVVPQPGGWRETDHVGVTLTVGSRVTGDSLLVLEWRDVQGELVMARTLAVTDRPPGCHVVLSQRVPHAGAITRFAASIMGADAASARAWLVDLDASFLQKGP